MIKLFNEPWHSVPTIWIDTETTGTNPAHDRAVQVGFARFEGGTCVATLDHLVNPGNKAIPPEATAIHGITDAMVQMAPRVHEVFAQKDVRELLEGAQPAAYNAPFDRHFVPPFGDDWTWPWLDCLSAIRVLDRFVRGKGRHKLETSCARHGVELPKAHDAGADAKAAGELFYKVMPKLEVVHSETTLGWLLGWQRHQEAEEWFRFHEWLSRQPPMDGAA